MTSDLAERIKAHRPAILEMLSAGDTDGQDASCEGPPWWRERPRLDQADRAVIAWLAAGGRKRPDTPLDAAEWPMPPTGTPQAIAELVAPRAGWTAASWRGRLRQLADACEFVTATRAGELRAATRLLENKGIRQT